MVTRLCPFFGRSSVSLYFHIPFCRKKCPYCHFYVIPNKPSYHALLREGLAWEMERLSPYLEDQTIASVYIGGGTPVLFNLDWIPIHGEVTVEANPEEVTLESMKHLKSLGVNRLSLGVQSLDDTSLLTIGRGHSANRAVEAIFAIYEAGITNISIDLMYDLPSQTLASFEKTLRKVPKLPITHLSLYNMTIEPHTLFYKRQKSLVLPTEEESLRMHEMAIEMIPLPRYEISAFGTPSIHNTGYWTGRPFFGLGPSAFSYHRGRRFSNHAHLHKYHEALKQGKSPVAFSEELSVEGKERELLAIRLRLLEGVPNQTFSPAVEADIGPLIQEGYLERGSHLKLTKRGLLFYDTVASALS